MKEFSLRKAYSFATERKLGNNVDEIKRMKIKWHFTMTSAVRRGYMIELFRKNQIFDDFKKIHWPDGNTDWGLTHTKWLLGLKPRYLSYLKETGNSNL
jgi:hypothetical protein